MHTANTFDKVPSPPMERRQAFQVALAMEASVLGLRRYTAKQFLIEHGNGRTQTHLYHTLAVGRAYSSVMVDRIDAFIHRHLPDWAGPDETPSSVAVA